MKTHRQRAAALLITVFTAGTLLAGCGKSTIDGTKTALTINGENVTVGEVSMVTRYQSSLFDMYYGSYLGAGYYDELYDEETGQTNGDLMVDASVEELTDDILIAQHAGEYGVALSDEDKAEIEKAAQAYIDKNAEDIRALVGASKEDVIQVLTWKKLHSLLLDPLAADVDVDIPDEEAAQSSAHYVVAKKVTASDTVTQEDADKQNEALLKDMDEILKQIKESEDIAAADLNEIATGVNPEIYGYLMSWGKAALEDGGNYDVELVKAAATLKDGEVYDKVFESSDGSQYYIVRMDKVFDEEQTEAERGVMIQDRKRENLDNLLSQWKEAADIQKNDENLKTIKVTDELKFNMVFPEEESTDAAS